MKDRRSTWSRVKAYHEAGAFLVGSRPRMIHETRRLDRRLGHSKSTVPRAPTQSEKKATQLLVLPLQPRRLVSWVIQHLASVKELDELLVQGAHLEPRKPPVLVNGRRQRPALYLSQGAHQTAGPVLAL